MTKIEIYDPALCCSTGICGVDVDQEKVTFAADVDADRTHDELSAIGFKRQYLIVNGVLAQADTKEDPLALAVWRREQAALAAMPDGLKTLPVDSVSLKSFNLVGLAALRQLLAEGAVASQDAIVRLPKLQAPDLATLVDSLVGEGHGLIMLMGKGGGGQDNDCCRCSRRVGQSRISRPPHYLRSRRTSYRNTGRLS
jgi:hypothetical protein